MLLFYFSQFHLKSIKTKREIAEEKKERKTKQKNIYNPNVIILNICIQIETHIHTLAKRMEKQAQRAEREGEK